MAKILVVGSYLNTDEDADKVAEFGRCLGREVIRQKHILVNSCLSEFDRHTAEGADEERGDAKDNRIQTWISSGAHPTHEIGQLLKSNLPNWDPAIGIETPEPIKSADVLIFVRGEDGVNRAALWADSLQKPLLPVATFGGASNMLYQREMRRLHQRYTGRFKEDDFIILTEISKDLRGLARRIVSLAEEVLIPRTVSVSMSYTTEGEVGTHLNNLYDNYEMVCSKHDYTCTRVTELNAEKGIISSIKKDIDKAGFALIDLTEVKPNVLFEFGYADGLGKDFIVTAREGTELPFDVQDIGTIFWRPDNMSDFRAKLTEKFIKIAKKHGYVDEKHGKDD